MKQRNFCLLAQLLLVWAICVVPVNAQDADILLSNILSAVQKNIDLLKERIVDFVSEEEITVEEFYNTGKITKTINVISEYRVFTETTGTIPDCQIVYEALESLLPPGILREERETLSIKENGGTTKDFEEPFWVKGSIYADLFILCDRQNEKCFDYKLEGAGKINDRNAYVIKIEQKEADIGKKSINRQGSVSWNIRYSGFAFIDAGTMEIFQLNKNGINIDHTSQLTSERGRLNTYAYTTRHIVLTQFEYDKVKIRDQLLTLPVVKTVILRQENGSLNTVYKYRYDKHRAFTVDTKIMFGEMEDSVEQ